MYSLRRFVLTFLLSSFVAALSGSAADAKTAPLSVRALLTQALSDPELAGFQVQVAELTVKPGGVDNQPHRHDADLFVFVQSGAIETSFEQQPPIAFRAGQVFHEPRNILHASLRNLSATEPAKLLLFYVIKQGRATYTPAPANAHGH